ncbi:hypothetical protein [Coleofasciculus sp.]|uniref:hypothetical protein n=1 Tax=Coleofasciculus sp. TaxID=3100458 RepID=UPI0039F97299
MNFIIGTPNDDVAIVGTNEPDQIFALDGNDGIFSLDGDDTVFGGGGVDVIIGGGGNADFALITDFTLGQDTIQLASDTLFNDLEFGFSSGFLPPGATISFQGDLIAIIQSSVSPSALNNPVHFVNA